MLADLLAAAREMLASWTDAEGDMITNRMDVAAEELRPRLAAFDPASVLDLDDPATVERRVLGSLDDDDVMYDHPVAMSGEPMDPVLFVRWDAVIAALRAKP